METITYKGKEYPTRTVTIQYKQERKVTYTLAIEALTKAFNEASGDKDEDPANWDDEATNIDNEIYFYLETEEELLKDFKPGDIIELDFPFTYIAG